MIESYKNTKYKVKTPTGYKNFIGVRRTTKKEVLHILFDDNTELECSLDHIFVVDGLEVLGKDIKVNQKLSTNKTVTDIKLIKDNKRFLYDLVGVEGDSLYIADGIISHNCDFSSSGNTVISPELLQFYIQTTTQEPLEKRGVDGGLWVWENPDYGNKSYIVCADVARGDGSDYSAFHVIDPERMVQVAEYKGQLTTKDYGNMLVAIATEYNDALLVVENANVGWATLQQIIDRDYKNLYYTYKHDVLDSDAFLLNGYDLVNKTDMVAGFTTSTKIRPLMISKMELFMREKSVIVRSKRLLDELTTFIWKAGRGEAALGYNDDLVLSFCMGLWVRDTALRLRQAGIEINKAAMSGIRNSAKLYKADYKSNNPWKIQNSKGNSEDITWLL